MNATVNSSQSSVQQTTERTTRWVRRSYPVLLFIWWGLLPLLGLLALLYYGFTSFSSETIESKVKASTTAALTAAGHSWAKVDVSGQEVTLSGAPHAPSAGDAALAAARAATCSTWTGERVCAVKVMGDFAQAAPTPASTHASTPAPAPDVKTTTPAAAQKCEKTLADLLVSRKIEFATGKADLLGSSKVLLDEIAVAAKDCSGVIQVQGHTDSVGLPQMNKNLSQARAQAVVQALQQRGMASERLQATGFGADAPIADNATAVGRSHNRRIEFKVQGG